MHPRPQPLIHTPSALLLATVLLVGCGQDTPPPIEYVRQACQLIPAAAGNDAPAGPELEVEVVVEGVEIPWGLAWLPNGDMLFTERDKGQLRIVRNGQLQTGAVTEVDIAQISWFEEAGGLGTEGGLLGVLLHPDFAENRQFYMYWTARQPDRALINRLGLFLMSEDFSSAELDRILIDNIPGGIHHAGGRMRIGPDRKLYLGVGAYDARMAQLPDQVAGKLLRMNLDGSIPADNPTPGSYVFLSGIRNTQGFDWFDAHHLLVMEHGPTFNDDGGPFVRGWDEFNVFKAGENSGWPDVYGCDTAPGVAEPVMVWERSFPPGGATLYRGNAIPEWTGSFFTATLGLPMPPDEGQHLHRIQLSPHNPYVIEKREVLLKQDYGRLRTVAEGPDGYLYVTTSNCDARGRLAWNPNHCRRNNGDQILRIVGLK
jgi:glucose/arabinose dehydrogenase